MSSAPFDPAYFLLWLLAFVFSTTCHEAAHAWAAKLGGDLTAYYGGQVSLNPWPHIRREPFGMIIIPLIMYATTRSMIGWASAPFDPHWAQRHPRRAALMAAAGPAANVLLVVVSIVALRILIQSGWALAPREAAVSVVAEPLVQWLYIMVLLNTLLATFNIVPLPPLDGAAVVEGLGGAGVRSAMQGLRRSPIGALLGVFAAMWVYRQVGPTLTGFVTSLITAGHGGS